MRLETNQIHKVRRPAEQRGLEWLRPRQRSVGKPCTQTLVLSVEKGSSST